MNKPPTQEQINDLKETAVVMGVIKKKNATQMAPVRIAYHPYKSSRQFYDQVSAISKAWQKYISLISTDTAFIEKVFKQTAQSDQFIRKLLDLFQIRKNCCEPFQFIFGRCDFFKDLQSKPKLIQYNLIATSMSSHSQNFHEAKKLTNSQNSHQYPQNKPNNKLVDHIQYIFKKGQLKGALLIVTSSGELNIIEICKIQLQAKKRGINVFRITLDETGQKLRNEGDLLFMGKNCISMVYFRTGYQHDDYKRNIEGTWKGRKIIETSSAIKIPSINMQLINQKRMQVQMSKPQNYNKYLSPQEAQLIKESLVDVYQFDNISEEDFSKLLQKVKKQQGEYILKPNLEGGSHNFYGADVVKKLQEMDSNQRKSYILMKKIHTEPVCNVLIDGANTIEAKCICELSHYGIIRMEKCQLAQNQILGYLIRIKPQKCNEGGIMAGVGSICSWVLEDEA